jgi:phosphate transport system protein
MTLSKEDFAHHISGQFNEDLLALHTQVLEMSRLVQAQIRDATAALFQGNVDLAASVIRRGVEANARELDLDGECRTLRFSFFRFTQMKHSMRILTTLRSSVSI